MSFFASTRLLESVKKTVQRLMGLRKPVVIDEKDLIFSNARGSGPGGQAVAKTSNMAIIQHRPTGILIKNHETRSLEQNRKLAMKNLKRQLDNMINGECSNEAMETLKARAKKQVKANKARKKHNVTPKEI